MKSIYGLLAFTLIACGDFTQSTLSSTPIDQFVPAIGFRPGNPNQTQDSLGPTGVHIPGRCPPRQDQLNARVQLKNPQFPNGLDLESRISRYERTLSSLQDLRCPAASTTLLPRLKSLTALRGDPNAGKVISKLSVNQTPAG